MSTDRISEYLTQFSQTRAQMLDQLHRVIVGQAEVIEQILAAIHRHAESGMSGTR